MDLKRLKKQLKSDEGYRSRIYEDTLSKSTIGYGHRVLSTEPDLKYKISGGFDGEVKAEIFFDKLLDKDMAIAIADAKSLIGEDHPPEVLEGFSNMAFQLGKTKLDGPLGFVDTIKLIKNGQYTQAAREMLLNDRGDGPSLWAKQTPKRAKRVSTLFANSEDNIRNVRIDINDLVNNNADWDHPDFDFNMDLVHQDTSKTYQVKIGKLGEKYE